MDILAKTRQFLRSPIPSCSGTAFAYYFGSFVAQLSIDEIKRSLGARRLTYRADFRPPFPQAVHVFLSKPVEH
jgi:hypothetical protein